LRIACRHGLVGVVQAAEALAALNAPAPASWLLVNVIQAVPQAELIFSIELVVQLR